MYKYFKNSSYTKASLNSERKKLSLKYHPDRGGKESDFIAMNEEYEVVLQQINNWIFQQKVSEYNPEQYIGKYKASDFYPKNEAKKIQPKKWKIIVSFLKEYLQNKIFYRIIFFCTAMLWLPAAIHLDISKYTVLMIYSIPLLFALYTRIHIFAWFFNLFLSGVLITKLQITFMTPYFNFWFFFLIVYSIAYIIATMEDGDSTPTKEHWNDLWRKIRRII